MMNSSTPKAMLYKAFALLFIVGILLFVGCWVVLWVLYLVTGNGGPIYGEITTQIVIGDFANIALFVVVIGILGLLAIRAYDWIVNRRTVS
ncbi:MAG: hypothetical protein RTU92_07130 [Candidatus Thorarchaeota archaeon]